MTILFRQVKKTSAGVLLFCLSSLLIATSCQEDRVDFNTQVRPILNKSCISCHGGVKQSGGFGLIFRENALGETKNGKLGIVPGHPEKSEMIARIKHANPEMRMPLDRDPLKPEEIEVLEKWIEQGAQWEEHWAYLPPEDPEVPETGEDWAANPIDQFVYARMEENELSPSEQADKYDLIRRLYLDVTGVPPTIEQVEQFVANTDPDAYEKTVDQLLASPKYGEHWASMWLDLARYADSKGYEADRARQIWKYRDWVIKAFNDDMPFDQFTIEQLAGDLLPDPSTDQMIATAFHRNTLNNGEGGTDNEEYRVSSVIDRVNTTWEVWQATTMSCVQCHSHPYDPIKHEEYFTSYAFFNNTADWDVPTEHPVLKEFQEEEEARLEEVKQWIEQQATPKLANKWERFVRIAEPKLRPEDFDDVENVIHHNRSGQDYMQVYDGTEILIKQVDLRQVDRIYLSHNQSQKAAATFTIRADSATGRVLGETQLNKTGGFKHIPVTLNNAEGVFDLYFQFKGAKSDYTTFIDGFLLGEKLPTNKAGEIYETIDELLNAKARLTTPVMVEKLENHGRKTNVFIRGNWMVKGDEVSPGIPKLLNPNEKNYKTRMDLAQWLISEENPLTARVTVNRIWAKIFGKGIVLTVEDFGTLGDYPTHPELLDWLALRFAGEWQWSFKTLIKNIVMTSTYKQSAKVSAIAKEKDPNNKWLARSPRVRLSAEQIRDQALAVSGLLSDKMNGPSVMPHQPEGVWSVVYNGQQWITSEGEDAYRRALYTYVRRSSPYPSFLSFDASGREVCLSRRIITNTPLQALITLNDPVYVEAAQNLAREVLKIDGDKKTKAEKAYVKVMGKSPDPGKVDVLVNLLNETEQYYSENVEEAEKLVQEENPELASLTVMANALMNMDEFIVKN